MIFVVRTTARQEEFVADMIVKKLENEIDQKLREYEKTILDVNEEERKRRLNEYRKKLLSELKIYSIIIPPESLGYIFVEAEHESEIRRILLGVRHYKGIARKNVDINEIRGIFEYKPPILKISIGDIIEITAGPLKGERGKVTKIDEKREEVTIELLNAAVPIPVTIKAGHIRLVKKAGEEEIR